MSFNRPGFRPAARFLVSAMAFLACQAGLSPAARAQRFRPGGDVVGSSLVLSASQFGVTSTQSGLDHVATDSFSSHKSEGWITGLAHEDWSVGDRGAGQPSPDRGNGFAFSELDTSTSPTAAPMTGSRFLPALIPPVVLLSVASTARQTPTPGSNPDANRDGVVDKSDLTLVERHLGSGCGQAAFDLRADVNGDCVVNGRDVAIVARNLGQRLPLPIIVPAAGRVTEDGSGQKLVADEIVVILPLKTADPDGRIRMIANLTGGRLVGGIPDLRVYQLLYVVPDLTALETIRLSIEDMTEVQAAVFHYLADRPLLRIPNDPAYSARNAAFALSDSWNEVLPETQWHLVAIGAPAGWDLTTGSPAVTVGILDVDFDIQHQDLVPNLTSWWGPSTAGFGHGTHVAGLACASGDNGIGVTGLTWRCSLKVYDYGSPVNSPIDPMLVANAMVRAIQDGVRIANMSIGFVDNNQCGTPGNFITLQKVFAVNAILGSAIEFGRNANSNVLWVAAAGNECRDARFQSPASLVDRFPDNVITVAATRRDGRLSGYSNFGNFVSVAAPGGENNVVTGQPSPGEAVTSTVPNNRYEELAGTSMAAPLVTGLAALVLTKYPDLSAAQIKQCIVNSTGPPILGNSFGSIDVARAVVCSMRLTVSKSGSGSGGIVSNPAGIDCGSNCVFGFPVTSVVALSAAPALGSTFTGWGGDCASAGASASATVIMSAAKQCTANFDLPSGTALLSVVFSGGGTGSVTSAPTGINCEPTCSASFALNTSVQLTAAVATGSLFAGWSGGCTGTSPNVTIALSSSKTCVAIFTTPDAPIFQTIDFPGASDTVLLGINNSGDVVGVADQAFVMKAGTFTAIEPPPGSSPICFVQPCVRPNGINDAGQITGNALAASGFADGFLLSGGSYSTVHYPSSLETFPLDVNDAGVIVGQYRANVATTPQAYHAFALNAGAFRIVDPPGSTGHAAAMGVNNAGSIVGTYLTAPNRAHGFLLDSGSYSRIDVPGATLTWATGINATGEIVGTFLDGSSNWQGFLLDGVGITVIIVPGARQTFVTGINDAGRIVGYYESGGHNHGFVSDRKVVPFGRYDVTDLGTLGGNSSYALGISDISGAAGVGVVVGYSNTGNGLEHGFVWRAGSGMTDLNAPGDGTFSRAYAAEIYRIRRGDVVLNALGVAGVEYLNGRNDAFFPSVWPSGTPIAVTHIAGRAIEEFCFPPCNGLVSFASDINHAGVVVGTTAAPWGDTYVPVSFRWSGTTGLQTFGFATSAAAVNDFGDVVGWGWEFPRQRKNPILWKVGEGGVMQIAENGVANGINNSRQIVGGSNGQAFSWDVGGGARNLGTLGGNRSEANGVNDSRQVVGWAETPSGGKHAIVWSAAVGMRDLNNAIPSNSGWILIEAKAINSSGQIVGYGVRDGLTRAFLLRPSK
jgi:probable HAF family extracellular repeat protein